MPARYRILPGARVLPGLAALPFLLLGCGGQGVLVSDLRRQDLPSPAHALAELQDLWTHRAIGEALIAANGLPGRPGTDLIRIRWLRGKAWCGDAPLALPAPGRRPTTWSEWLALATPPGLFHHAARTDARWTGRELVLEGSPRIVSTFRDGMPVTSRLELGSQAMSIAMLVWS